MIEIPDKLTIDAKCRHIDGVWGPSSSMDLIWLPKLSKMQKFQKSADKIFVQ